MLAATSLVVLASLAQSAFGLISTTDSSQVVSTSTFTKAKGEGFTKAIIRGYQEACSSGGRVDPNFVTVYNNARAAGITNIDTYWYPCTGSGNSCKSFATQIAEIGATFDAHSMKIGTIWVDMEKDSACNTWNYGSSGNLAEAKKMVSAMKASGYVFGIYSSPGEWSNIFGSYGVVLDHSYPLWFADWNNQKSLTIPTKFGGWTSAVGHQYTDQSASGLFDLSVFSK